MDNAHPAIRQFAICEALKWTMPVAGGLYDQDPELLDWWMILISEKAKHDKAEQEKMGGGKKKGGSGVLGKSAKPVNVKGPKLAGRFNDGH